MLFFLHKFEINIRKRSSPYTVVNPKKSCYHPLAVGKHLTLVCCCAPYMTDKFLFILYYYLYNLLFICIPFLQAFTLKLHFFCCQFRNFSLTHMFFKTQSFFPKPFSLPYSITAVLVAYHNLIIIIIYN